MNTIENEIRNIRDKVDILKIYGPKILKNSSKQTEVRLKYAVQSKAAGSESQSVKLMNLV